MSFNHQHFLKIIKIIEKNEQKKHRKKTYSIKISAMTQAQFQGSKDVASWICKTFLQPGHQSWRFLIWSQEPVVNSTAG